MVDMEALLSQGERQTGGQQQGAGTEPFTNLFPQMNLNNNCLILIIILIILIMFKEDIMKIKIIKDIFK